MKWSIILLVILNLASLAMVWYAFGSDNGKPHGAHSNAPNPENFFKAELNWSDAQVDQYRTLRQAHHEKVKKVLGEIRELKEKMFSLITSDDQSQVDPVIASIASKQGEVERLTYTHFAGIRNLCDDTQRQKFDSLLSEIKQKVLPNPGKKGAQSGPPPPQ